MTARIGYLTALAPGHGDSAVLSPPRRLFPPADFLDAEAGFRDLAPPGPTDPAGPADRPSGGQPEVKPQVPSWREAGGRDTGPGEHAAGPDGEGLSAAPMAAELARADGPALEPAEVDRTADSTPAPPDRARPAARRSGSPGDLLGYLPRGAEPAHVTVPRSGAGADELPPPVIVGPGAETVRQASPLADGLSSGPAPMQPFVTPVASRTGPGPGLGAAPGPDAAFSPAAALSPGAAPGPRSARPASRDTPSYSPAADQGPALRPSASPGSVRRAVPEAEQDWMVTGFPGAPVLHESQHAPGGPVVRAELADAGAGRAQPPTTEAGAARMVPGFPDAAVQAAVDWLSAGHAAHPGLQAQRPAAEAGRENEATPRPARIAPGAPAASSEMPQQFPAAVRPPDRPSAHAAELRPRRQARAPAAPTSASTFRPTLSIGTIEVILLAPAHDPVPAGAARRAPRHTPERLSRGLGPHFGQGQT
jgi:hypothetical protein